jgi:aspartyl-tRNA(Asn)/glutamyl-tRNA(Gln) amidotransferase subunit A
MTNTSLSQIRESLQSGALTVRALTESYLQAANKAAHLNAFLELFTESALQQADAVDARLREGKAGKLAGMVIGLKDNICYKNHKVSAASRILEGFTSLYSATAVERLLAEDAVIIGRLNCDEFAMGSSNENSAFGAVKNPLDTERVPGGSSGGSAAAVAAGLCLAALGSDTGGSIRQPASFTGTVGYKPTYGRVSRYGLIAYASSFDQIGPITHNVEDAALIMDVISGMDDFDSTAIKDGPLNASATLQKTGPLRFTLLTDCVDADGTDPEIRTAIRQLAEALKQVGHTVTEAAFGHLQHLVPCYYVLTTAEASSNLSRFDGVHYGYRDKAAHDVESTYVLSRSNGFGAEVKRRIMLGTFVLSSGYYDAYFDKGHRVRRLIRNRMNALLSDSDFLLLPTAPSTAFKIGENAADPITMYLQDIFTVKANLSGNPAVSLPLHTHSNGLPFGTQLIGKMGADAELLACSSMLAHLSIPPVA